MSTQSLKRELTTKDLIVYGALFMIPIAPFAWYGVFVGDAEGMVALAYLIGLIAMLFTGFSYATMAAKYPISGSVYTYVQMSTKAELGFLAGWAVMIDYFLLPAGCFLMGAEFCAFIYPAIPAVVWFIILATATTVVNALGVKMMANAGWVLFILQIICIAWFVIGALVLIAKGGAELNYVSFYNAENFTISGVLKATVIVILSYLGFDAISTLSEETKDPKRMVGKATILSILTMGIVFVLIAWLGGCVLPDYTTVENTTVAFVNILHMVGGKPLAIFGSVLLAISFGFSCGLEGQTAVTRIMYSMGRDGMLPKFFSKLNKHHVPGQSIILVGIISALLATAGLGVLATLMSFGALIGFLMLNASVIWKFFIQDPEKTIGKFIKYCISPALGFIVCGYILSGMGKQAFTVGILWLALGVLLLAVKTKGFKTPAPKLNLEEDPSLLD